MHGRRLALLFVLCASFGVVSCDVDDGTFRPEELAATITRLSLGRGAARGDVEHVRTQSVLAIPTAAYANAFADMRSPLPSFQPNPFSNTYQSGINGIKLSLPGFALKEVSSANSGRQDENADLRTHHALDNPIKLAIPDALLRAHRSTHNAELWGGAGGGGASVLRALAGAHAGVARGGQVALGQVSLSGVAERKVSAVERLSAKHAALQTGAAGGLQRMSEKPVLDKKIKAYHGVLANAVMVLAVLAGTAICSGIGAVIYCWRTRERGFVRGGSKYGEPTQREDTRGKNYGRSTPQYGSYGSAMKRPV